MPAVEDMILPVGWDVVKLGEVFNTTSGGTPSRKNADYYIGHIPWVKSGELKHKTIFCADEKISEAAVKNSSAKIFPKGTLLIALYGSNIGKLAKLGIDAATNQAICGIFENAENSLDYLYWYLYFQRPSLVDAGTGGAQPNISQTLIKNLFIPLPPLAEQIKIVEKIEELFSELDNAVATLKTTQQQLQTYRQSVLKHAFEGHFGIKSNDWSSTCIQAIAENIQIGPFGSQLHQYDYISEGIPLVNPTHIKNGKIVADNDFTITKEKRDSLPNYILREGDVIMGRRGEMGRCAIVTKKESGWFCGTGSLFIRPNKTADTTFIFYYLSSRKIKEHLEEVGAGTTMTNLNLKIIKSIPVLLPPIGIQQEIVLAIETRLSESDNLLQTINQQLAHAESLRQSILQKAFVGELV